MSNKPRIIILKSYCSQQVNNTLQEPGLPLKFVKPRVKVQMDVHIPYVYVKVINKICSIFLT